MERFKVHLYCANAKYIGMKFWGAIANESELQKEQVTAQQDLHWIVRVSVTQIDVKYMYIVQAEGERQR